MFQDGTGDIQAGYCFQSPPTGTGVDFNEVPPVVTIEQQVHSGDLGAQDLGGAHRQQRGGTGNLDRLGGAAGKARSGGFDRIGERPSADDRIETQDQRGGGDAENADPTPGPAGTEGARGCLDAGQGVRPAEAAEGELGQNVELGAIQEMARLASSFNTMAEKLRNSFSALRSTNRESRRLAQQRSEELMQREQQLALEARQRRRLEQTLQQVSQVAREPLLADPLTGLLSRRGLERRLASPLPREAQPPSVAPRQPDLLLQLRIAPSVAGVLAPEQLERIASALEQLSAEHDGLAAHGGGSHFTLVLCGLSEIGRAHV